MSKRLRVVVADDSLTVRKRIVEILSSDPGIEVVGEADNGARAIELCTALKPDVVTLDMVMPIMTGVAATEYIMAYCPTPILIVSSSTQRGEVFKTYDALAAGAVEVLDKSDAIDGSADWERKLIDTVKLVARIKVITHPKMRLGSVSSIGAASSRSPSTTVRPLRTFTQEPRLVAIGASTGGPAAIQTILSSLPKDFALPVLFVIHIGEPFGSVFAEWLDGHSPIPVRTVRDGELLPPVGKPGVLMAPPDRHVVLSGGRLYLTCDAERHSCRPAVDVLFESVAREAGPEAVGCLLTGMGRDGASGLLAMRESGGLTIAQDQASSVVFGMPKEAIELGAATQVLPLKEIGPTLVRLASKASQKGGDIGAFGARARSGR